MHSEWIWVSENKADRLCPIWIFKNWKHHQQHSKNSGQVGVYSSSKISFIVKINIAGKKQLQWIAEKP